jgi:hypothetical protein
VSAAEDLHTLRAVLPGGVWAWERDGRVADPHCDSWTLYINRGEPITDALPRGHFANQQHGFNVLGRADFDVSGEDLRSFIVAAVDKVPLLLTERDVERKAWARLVKANDSCHAGHRASATSGYYSADIMAQADAERAEVEAARRALRDLGVDVDALLEEK